MHPAPQATQAREAIETALSAYWNRHVPAVSLTPVPAQLSCLRAHLPDVDTAQDITSAWAGLNATLDEDELPWLVAIARRGVSRLEAA